MSVSLSRKKWIRAWGASPRGDSPAIFLDGTTVGQVQDQTLQQRFSIGSSGTALRLRFSNEHGARPLRIGQASLGFDAHHDRIAGDSRYAITFCGATEVSIPIGAYVLSDPLDFFFTRFDAFTARIYLPHAAQIFDGFAPTAMRNIEVSATGNYTNSASFPRTAQSANQPLLTAVDAYTDSATAVVLAIGDSITEGATGISGGWPGCLSRRLALGQVPHKAVAVVNAGIGGNQVLRDGFGASLIGRFDRDALMAPGVTHIVLVGGTNDIGMPGATRLGQREWIGKAETPSSNDLIFAYQQLIARAREKHIKIYGGTLPPFGGPTPPDKADYNSPYKESIRQAVNHWIRTSGAYDGVIDFEAAVRAPDNPGQLRPEYDLGDHVHPNDQGHQALADAIDLSFFD